MQTYQSTRRRRKNLCSTFISADGSESITYLQFPQYIYFLQSMHGGPIKIGTTQSLIKRLKSISLLNPFELQLLLTMDGGYEREAQLHQQFKHLRHHGEWFH